MSHLLTVKYLFWTAQMFRMTAGPYNSYLPQRRAWDKGPAEAQTQRSMRRILLKSAGVVPVCLFIDDGCCSCPGIKSRVNCSNTYSHNAPLWLYSARLLCFHLRINAFVLNSLLNSCWILGPAVMFVRRQVIVWIVFRIDKAVCAFQILLIV